MGTVATPPRTFKFSVPLLVLLPEVNVPVVLNVPATLPPPETGPEKLPVSTPGPPGPWVTSLAVPCKDPEQNGEQIGEGGGLKLNELVFIIWKSKLPPSGPGEAMPEPLAEKEET